MGLRTTTRQPAPASLLAALLTVAALSGCQSRQPPEDPASYIARIESLREERDNHYRTTLYNAFGLIDRHYFDTDERLTIGSGKEADLRIDGPGIDPVHAVIQGLGDHPRLLARGKVTDVEDPSRPITELTLENKTGFQIGRYHLRFNVSRTGRRNVEVYDPEHPNVLNFESLEYFPVDPHYRVMGNIVPYDDPGRVTLIDSQGSERPYYLFGELRFTLDGRDETLELYTTSLDPEVIAADRHMLIFRDATSGTEAYPAARYLYIEGKTGGEVEVDFNTAFNPSCNYSYQYQCALPRPNNTLDIPIPAGEKWYRKHAVEITSVPH